LELHGNSHVDEVLSLMASDDFHDMMRRHGKESAETNIFLGNDSYATQKLSLLMQQKGLTMVHSKTSW